MAKTCREETGEGNAPSRLKSGDLQKWSIHLQPHADVCVCHDARDVLGYHIGLERVPLPQSQNGQAS